MFDFSSANFGGANRNETINVFANDSVPMVEKAVDKRFNRVRTWTNP